MTYQDTIDWMFSQLPMYQRQGQSAFKKDLSNTLKLVQALNHPEREFKSIHVAGTNGKGSTSHMIASVLQEAGYKVGLYTSPHLKDFRERIKINGEVVSKTYVIDFIAKYKPFFEANELSFFEMTVGMAFDYFAKEKVDIAVIEVGMGGRLDSTNVITPEVSVITNIGLDHTQFLGTTLDAIAREKGGIIKKHIPVVIGETQQETKDVFLKLAKDNNSDIIFADQLSSKQYRSDLIGAYQNKNIITVQHALKQLQLKGFVISEENIVKGLQFVVKNTGLLGRWQILNLQPKVVCDTGHNRDGLTYVMNQFAKENYNKLHIVFGVVSDKDLNSIIDLLPQKAEYYFCKPDIPRGLNADKLREAFAKYNLFGKSYPSVNKAYEAALQNAEISDFVFIGGSNFVVAEIL
ncbi:bifunctional folylpolyglutamate synthase/dihydrofolate synthase [Aestuariibaculum sediminum]|uniref:Dihydrofolate synthase/folylpolyglutamate synthase n=1 Tax=Aestuariibaculum sediminum TaxID=2770637 RepID=A0A8J6U829_9FLAO|nr:folylpolyglutamate synthase/dihydrofolate synthase family protein [Aestuariibaculum sediminum]MBD0830762.1 bifunctional folylpolyglutamate synthase/dihydrofolate synthase [Aestuariibaculum sediminum]